MDGRNQALYPPPYAEEKRLRRWKAGRPSDRTAVLSTDHISLDGSGDMQAAWLYDKVQEAKRQVETAVFRRSTPTVADCDKWLLMQSAHVRNTTLRDYRSKIKNYIVAPLGDRYMAEVNTDDVELAMVPASKKSCSMYRSVNMLIKSIFNSAVDSKIIPASPCKGISAKGGKPQKD